MMKLLLLTAFQISVPCFERVVLKIINIMFFFGFVFF